MILQFGRIGQHKSLKCTSAFFGELALLTLDELGTVARENDKQHFSFSEDGLRIRANQGHSIKVDLY
jgi:RNA:NAD 2'-phosphotransferase (TPT1/KptA family)